MNRSIWKYSAPINDRLLLMMPEGAQIVCVQMQGETPCLWALVDCSAQQRQRAFSWRGTGQRFDEQGEYIGTVQLHSGALVFHLFEVKP